MSIPLFFQNHWVTSFFLKIICLNKILKKKRLFVWEREHTLVCTCTTGRDRGRGEADTSLSKEAHIRLQAGLYMGSPRGSIKAHWDHNQGTNQESHAQSTEPPRCPWVTSFLKLVLIWPLKNYLKFSF